MRKHSLFFLFVGVVIMGFVFLTAPNVMAIPYDGPSVSISESQFYYDAATKMFGTIANNDVIAQFLDGDSITILYLDGDISTEGFFDVFLDLTPVDFSSGFNSGTGGGFTIYDGSGDILSGTFENGSIFTSDNNEAKFETSVIINFVNYNRLGVDYNPPGLFSATLGNVGVLAPGTSFTTGVNATATIQSTAVPEPATLLLLGAGLIGLGLIGEKWLKAREK